MNHAVAKCLLLTALLTFMGGCGELQGAPIPLQYQSIVGTWRANGITLVITADGGVSYDKVSAQGKRNLNGPCKSVSDTEIAVGVLFFIFKLRIDELPHRSGKLTVFTVNGDVLVKRDTVGKSVPIGR